MNKYVVIGIVFVLIIAGGSVYRAFFLPEADRPIVTGVERSLSIVTFEDTWKFEPEFIEAEQGDKITMTVTNNDDYDHGFAIDAFGISQRMPALETITVEFIVTKAGDFPYYCSVSCGSGIVDGVERGHFDQVGKLHVRSAISETSGLKPAETTADFAKSAKEAAVLTTARTEAEKYEYDISSLEAIFDEENTLWTLYSESEGISAEDLRLPENDKFQAVLYRDSRSRPVLWFFIDATDGEFISAYEVVN